MPLPEPPLAGIETKLTLLTATNNSSVDATLVTVLLEVIALACY
jgi:hypothetical protein